MTSENGLSAADVAAVTGNGGGFGGWGDGSFWIIVLFLFALMGNGFGNGWNNGGGAMPYVVNNDVQRGFDQSAIMGGITGLTTTVTNGFANAEISRCNGQTNILQTLAGNQMANMQGFNSMGTAFQQCLSHIFAKLKSFSFLSNDNAIGTLVA